MTRPAAASFRLDLLVALALVATLAACGDGSALLSAHRHAHPPTVTPAAAPAVVEPAPAAAPEAEQQAPLPEPIACAAGSGHGTHGLQLYGHSRIGATPAAAQQTLFARLAPGQIRFDGPEGAEGTTTGALRARLWAVPQGYRGGPLTGYVMATYDIRTAGGSDTLHSGEALELAERTVALRTPPAGAYCLVVTLEQHDAQSCRTADRYCTSDWVQFSRSSSFR